MNYSFHPDAKKELLNAIDYFEECRPELGIEFSKEIFSVIQRIIYFPRAWSKFSKKTKRCLVNRFPFGVIYQIIDDEIYIIAIMQLNRDPNYLVERIK